MLLFLHSGREGEGFQLNFRLDTHTAGKKNMRLLRRHSFFVVAAVVVFVVVFGVVFVANFPLSLKNDVQ